MLFSRPERTDTGPDRRSTVMIGMVPSSQTRYLTKHMNRDEEPQRRILRVAAWLPPKDRDYVTETSFSTDDRACIYLKRLTIWHVLGGTTAELNAHFSTRQQSIRTTESTPISFSDLRGTDLNRRIMTTLGSNIDLTLTGQNGPLCVSVRPPFTDSIEDFLTTALNAADWLKRQLHVPYENWFASMALHVYHQCQLTRVGGTDTDTWIDAGRYALWQMRLISDIAAAAPREIPHT